MSMITATPTTRSDKLFATAFSLASGNQHRHSDEYLELGHELRALEQKIALIAQHAPTDLAVLLVKSAMTGFTDDVDPSEYLEANREPIRFYAENDAQLRELIRATFNPVPYEKDEIRLSEAELEAARAALVERAKASPGSRSVTDPVITPAAIALQARGFETFTNQGGCSILRECPDCKGKYSTKVHFNRRIYWHCPHCNLAKEA